jgi:crotonobetainyl-CoA:carnitine CoA-transferase CaiB-like acyl-CoA transferase
LTSESYPRRAARRRDDARVAGGFVAVRILPSRIKVPQISFFVARALRFDDFPQAPSTQPPTLGEHTFEVFEHWLGWTLQEITRFSANGAFGDAAVTQLTEQRGVA